MWLDIYLVMIIGLCLINFDQCIHIPCMNHQNIENPFKMTVYLYHIIITIPPAEVSQTIVHSWFVHYWLPPDSLFFTISVSCQMYFNQQNSTMSHNMAKSFSLSWHNINHFCFFFDFVYFLILLYNFTRTTNQLH